MKISKNNLYRFVVEIVFTDVTNFFPSGDVLEENAFLRKMNSTISADLDSLLSVSLKTHSSEGYIYLVPCT